MLATYLSLKATKRSNNSSLSLIWAETDFFSDIHGLKPLNPILTGKMELY